MRRVQRSAGSYFTAKERRRSTVFPATSAFRKTASVLETHSEQCELRGRMLREHRGFFSSGLVVESPSEHRPHFADVFCTLRSDFALAASSVWVRRGVPALPISREREGGSFTGGARGKAGLFVTFH